MTTNILDRAKHAAAERLRQVNRDANWRDPAYPDHLEHWWDNLLDGVTRTDCEEDLGMGAGVETLDRKHKSGVIMPAKFCAPHSSSALTVNTFGPFRHQPAHLRLDGRVGFTKAQFEYRCDNGLRTRHLPHFDFFAESPDGVIAVESKFLEPLGKKKVDFKPQYDGPFRGAGGRAIIAEPPWRAVFEELKSGTLHYKHFDAAQLVKHYLGIRVNFDKRHRTLVYLFWEPANLQEVAEFQTDRKEVMDFAAWVTGCDTRFAFVSYAELWRDWKRHCTLPGLSAHLARLEARYHFPI
jgi:hypothetical protein